MAKEWVVRNGDQMKADKYSNTVWIPYTKQAQTGKVPLYFSQFLTRGGTGGGQLNMTGDFAAGTIVSVTPAAGETFRIEHLKVSFGTTAAISAELYGNLTALGTGILIRLMDNDGTVLALTDSGLPIKSINEYSIYADEVTRTDYGLEKTIRVDWDFSAAGTALRIEGDSNERLEVKIEGDVSGLIGHKFLAQGFKESTTT